MSLSKNRFRPKLVGLLLTAATLFASAGSAAAAPIQDPVGDFLPTYIGGRGGDMDVVSADVGLIGSTLRFFALLNGPVGLTPGGFFVWGLDRGAGTQRFLAGSPSVGAGVFFDSVVIINANATGSINLFGLGGTTSAITSPILIAGNTIAFDLPVSMFPSQGRAFSDYGWNLWPRDGAGNAHIADFAPDASTPRVTAIPIAPTALLLALGGLVGIGATKRRRGATASFGTVGPAMT